MSDLESRIDKLEKYTSAEDDKEIILTAVYDDTGKPSEAALEAAKAEYKAKHPEWQGRVHIVIWVDEHTKELIEHIGDRTKSLSIPLRNNCIDSIQSFTP